LIPSENFSASLSIARTIASLSGNAVLSGSLGARLLYKTGIHEVLSQPELEDSSLRKHFGDVIDSFEENIDAFSEELEDKSPAVFIGRENPITNAKEFSMIVSKYRMPKGDGIVVIFGPKRMNYKKNLHLLDALTDLLD